MQSFYSDVLQENSLYIAGAFIAGLAYVIYSVSFHDL
jgi:hypothetical protein